MECTDCRAVALAAAGSELPGAVCPASVAGTEQAGRLPRAAAPPLSALGIAAVTSAAAGHGLDLDLSKPGRGMEIALWTDVADRGRLTLGGPALDQFDGVVVGVGDPRHAQIAEPVVGLVNPSRLSSTWMGAPSRGVRKVSSNPTPR